MAEDELLVFGLSHRSAVGAVRERLQLAEAELPARLAELGGLACGEALLLSTCDRLEVVLMTGEGEAALARLGELFAAWLALSPAELAGQLRCHRGEAALRHLFAVAASLDSQVVGEPQVLGQVKAAHRQARAAGCLGPRLERVLQAAYAAAKRVRSETAIGERPVSLLASAREVARELFGDLDRVSGLLLGLGEMGELLLGDFLGAGLRRAVVSHPNAARALAAAERLGCDMRRWEERERALAEADLVIAAAGSGSIVVTQAAAAAALKARRRRPIFFIDAALPRDIEPSVGALEAAFLYDLEELEQAALAGRERRRDAAAAARQILEEELARFLRDRLERTAAPSLVALKGRLERLRREVLAAAPQADAREATRLLLGRLLHASSETLRRAAAEDPEAMAHLEDLLDRLFAEDLLAGKDES